MELTHLKETNWFSNRPCKQTWTLSSATITNLVPTEDLLHKTIRKLKTFSGALNLRFRAGRQDTQSQERVLSNHVLRPMASLPAPSRPVLIFQNIVCTVLTTRRQTRWSKLRFSCHITRHVTLVAVDERGRWVGQYPRNHQRTRTMKEWMMACDWVSDYHE